MPPAKTRVVTDDLSGSSRQTGGATSATTSRAKRQIPGIQQAPSGGKGPAGFDDGSAQSAPASTTSLSWADEDLTLLHKYRAAHRVDTPSAFKSFRNQCLLTNPGIGLQSPTMARKRSQWKTSKEQLALAVRKNFNGAAVNEVNVMVDLLYKIRNQNKSFRMRSSAAKSK